MVDLQSAFDQVQAEIRATDAKADKAVEAGQLQIAEHWRGKANKLLEFQMSILKASGM